MFGTAGEPLAIPTGTVGAMHELLVAADLMKRGSHVFRALSPSCPGDLMILQGSKIKIVEVTTGYRLLNGTLAYPTRKQTERFDVLAVVERTGKINYIPDWE
jgi:hypothetical protein